MAEQGQLATWVVEFKQEGLDALDAALKQAERTTASTQQTAQRAADKAGMDMAALGKSAVGAVNAMAAAMSAFDPTKMAIAAFTAKTAEKASGGMDMAALAKHAIGNVDPMAALMSQGHMGVVKLIPQVTLAVEAEKAAAKAFKENQQKMAEAAEAAARRITTTQLALAGGYVYLSSKLMGFIQAGIAGTGFADIMNFRFQQLHREIAAIFTPAIMGVINALEKLVAWFQRLDGHQQTLIRNTAIASVAFLGMVTILPQIAAGIRLVGVAIQAAMASTGIGAIVAVVGALAALFVGTEKGRSALGKMMQAFQPIIDQVTRLVGIVMDALAPALDGIVELIAAQVEAWGPVIQALMPVFELVGEIVQLLAGGMGAQIKIIAELVKDILVPAFELLRPVLELMAIVAKGFSGVIRALSEMLGIGGNRRRGGERFSAPSPSAGGFESIEATFRRLEEASNRTDIPQRQLSALEKIETNTASSRDALLRWLFGGRLFGGGSVVGA